MKSPLLPLLTLLLIISTNAFCQAPEEIEEVVDFYSQEEFIKAGKGTPKELESMGFTKYNLVNYEKEGDTEYFTFSDWRTIESGDTVTFVVSDGKTTEWFKERKVEKGSKET